ncbi:MAG: prepilin-type N-terminal cleavage/methylation domain-containing protein [Thermoguttaceae bacterium]|nr:prepilin-type N-terminal cleavage/methylation domain-containing protein [Thermoguttaceae bacterium]
MKRGSRGFTLMEVLVVLAILIAGFTALTQLQTSALKESAEAEEKTSIQVLCQNELDKILTGITELVPDLENPIPEFADWSYTVQYRPAPLPGLIVIRVVAQKSEYTRVPSDRPGVYDMVRKPLAEVTVAQWADPDRIRIAGRIPEAPQDDSLPRRRRPDGYDGGLIGSLSSPPAVDPYAAIEGDQPGFGSLTAPFDPFAASGFETPPDQVGGLQPP